MNKRLLVALLTVATQGYAFAEDFAEFKGPDLSPQQEKQIVNDLVDWSMSHDDKMRKIMIPEEYAAVKRYGRVDHDVINEFMRAGEPETFITPSIGAQLKGSTAHLRSAMNKIPNYKGTVYRGSAIKNSLLEKLNVGDILHEKGFLSTSTLPSMAKSFSVNAAYDSGSAAIGSASAAQFKIDLKTSGRAINTLTFKTYEAEVLAKPGTYFRIEAIEKISPEQNFIKMREVKNPSKYLKAEPDINIYDSFSGAEMQIKSRSALYCL
ncbi:ADP-ribosyltransferase [Vibrio sp. AND4]|uniref:ADP-ribosyltransferase n=1 Tax=Vibrio sp. AND4 TaxID=314289 RepID=UPI00015EFA70|nr:ADP-ribosyltransferase [Vibrio sp. AND4]EDP60218.1 hypothetical protein AND4_02378 [Vibrio sp. AND4]